MKKYLWFFAAVRYGRVPKRSREICGADESNIRVATPTTPLTPTTPQMCSIASPSEISPLAQDAELPPGTAELSVYDVILSVSQAHRAHCTYTEELMRGITRRPITVPTSDIKEECEVC